MGTPNKNNQRRITIPYRSGHPAETVDVSRSLIKARVRTRIDRIDYLNDTGLATHGSNYVALSAKNGATVVATGPNTNSSGGAAIVAGTVSTMTLSATKANRILAAGDTLTLFIDATGTPTLPAGATVVFLTELTD